MDQLMFLSLGLKRLHTYFPLFMLKSAAKDKLELECKILHLF